MKLRQHLLDLLILLAILAGMVMFALPTFPAEYTPAKTDLARWGLPEGNWQYHGEFVLAFDGRSRTPRWVMECLVPGSPAAAPAAVRSNQWKSDKNIPHEFRPTDEDYLNAKNLDRGHLAPAGDFGEQSDQDDTFTFSNCAPQASDLNRGLWSQLEKHCRALAADGTIVWILTCPLFDADVDNFTVSRIGGHRVWVPTHCAKSVLILPADAAHPTLRAWIIPNIPPPAGNTDLSKYAVTIDDLETRAGLDLWSKLEPALQKRLESAPPAVTQPNPP